MTTQLIESTSSAPTLAERAVAEWRRTVERHDREYAEARRREFDRKVDVLRIHLRDTLGLADGESIQLTVSETAPNDFTVTTADGLRFALDTYSRFRDSRDREQLHVAVECARGCGKELWVHVPSLEALGGILQPDATNMHDYPCLQQFDDEGEPTTDTLGNPLKPRAPYVPKLTPEQKARATIVALENAAARVAHALNTIAELEDARALIKPEAIKRLIEAGAGSSATAAEKIVERDGDYANHRLKQRDAECEKWGALAAYEAAKLSAALDVALVTTAMREV